MKRIIILLLLWVLIFQIVGCSRQTTTPPVQPPEDTFVPLPAERQISGRRLSYQGRELLAVFGDFAGVSDIVLNDNQLSYIEEKALWSNDLTAKHVLVHQEPTGSYELWYQEISFAHEAQRNRDDEVQGFFVTGNQWRFLERGVVLAYRELPDEASLVLTNHSGEHRVVVNYAKDLELLGWVNDSELVFYADLPAHGPNVYVVDVWDDLVAFNSQYTNTLSIGSVRFTDVVAGQTGHMWGYDENRIAYVLGGRVYTVDSSGISRVVATPAAPLARAERNLMIFHDFGSGIAPELQYEGRNVYLRQSSAQMPMEVDWLNGMLYYVFMDDEGSGVARIDLSTMEETELFYISESFRLTALALSPALDELIFLQVQEIVPDDGPYSDYINEVYRYDMISGHMLLLQGHGLHDRPMHHRFASAHWLREDLLALGQRIDNSPLGEAPLSLHRLNHIGEVTSSEQWSQHVELISQDRQHFFLADWLSGDGWDISMHFNIWYYDVAHGAPPRQLTNADFWQIQQDRALAYNEERGLLFISRLKGFEDQGYEYKRPIVHGVVVDLQGREYTLLEEGIRGIDYAVWLGEHLYVKLPGKIVRVTLQ